MRATASSRISIEPATPADLGQLVEIETRCFAADRLSRRSLARHLREQRNIVLKATTRRNLIGYALVLLHRSRRAARLYSIAIDPDARELGAGLKLLRAAERAARKAGCNAMILEVRPDNATATGLYRKNGYVVTGAKADFYADGAHAVCMKKALGTKR